MEDFLLNMENKSNFLAAKVFLQGTWKQCFVTGYSWLMIFSHPNEGILKLEVISN